MTPWFGTQSIRNRTGYILSRLLYASRQDVEILNYRVCWHLLRMLECYFDKLRDIFLFSLNKFKYNMFNRKEYRKERVAILKAHKQVT